MIVECTIPEEGFMNRFGIRRLSAGIMVGLASVSATAAAQSWTATLNGANESPPNASAGTGFALFVYNALAHTLSVNASFSGLTGTTTAAHLHCCTATALTGTAAVATTLPTFAGFPLGVTGGTYDVVLDMTSPLSYSNTFVTANGGTPLTAEARLIQGIKDGTVYFNIHTSAFPGGEIRGFVTPVPEPSTVVLLAGGLVVVGVLARRRRGMSAVMQG